ncbi:hypothetical protein B0O99DRAFT_280621 [Bisporella sp. PMI_857]|nr:hypothetical protein B0O99DRAFT_280621 [Bisporella sp. PMI_857]
MELSGSLLDQLLEPSFIFRQRRDFVRNFLSYDEGRTWGVSHLNPKNRIDSLEQPRGCSWRIDGATQYGTQFFTALERYRVPLRIDAFIPDQMEHPYPLRPALQSSLSVVERGLRVAELGIAKHICNALHWHSEMDAHFLKKLENLPFGSKIVFENVVADVADMKLHVIPAYDLERRFAPFQKLQQMWKEEIAPPRWPPIINILDLSLIRQLHDSISLVTIKGRSERFIFKSTTSDPETLYHEIKFLLQIAPHPNIIEPPKYLVTKDCAFGGRKGVCGFILTYLGGGSLRDVLPLLSMQEALTMGVRIRWSIQIVFALLHFRDQTGSFYSDLRPDNILLSDVVSNPDSKIVLVDFEQRGNWYSWTAPEIRCFLFLKELTECPNNVSQSPHLKPIIDELVSNYLPGSTIKNFENQRSIWTLFSPALQEKAMVYSLGLMLYCIFEGLSNPRINLATAFEIEPHIEFPEFKSTPLIIRECIMKCVGNESLSYSGSPASSNIFSVQSTSLCRKLTRVRDMLTLKHGTTCIKGYEPRQEEIFDVAMNHWTDVLKDVQNFLRNNEHETRGCSRPTLKEVLQCLQHLEQVSNHSELPLET